VVINQASPKGLLPARALQGHRGAKRELHSKRKVRWQTRCTSTVSTLSCQELWGILSDTMRKALAMYFVGLHLRQGQSIGCGRQTNKCAIGNAWAALPMVAANSVTARVCKQTFSSLDKHVLCRADKDSLGI